MAARYTWGLELPTLKQYLCDRAVAPRPEVLNFCFGHCLLSLGVLNPCKDVWVKLADDFFCSGMPRLNMVVDSGLMLIEIVTVNRWTVSIDPGGSEVFNQLNSWDVWGTLLDVKPGCPGIRKWIKCH